MRKKWILAGVFLIAIQAHANVSLKNGNFFMGYTDMVYSGGYEPKIDRVYNSKSPYHGIFGWGWGNEYEVHLTVSADGSVVVHEYGGGAENRFAPKSLSEKDLNEAVATVAAVAQKSGAVGSANQLAEYKQRLKSDAFFRNDEWEKFRSQGKVAARTLKVGTQLHSNHFSYQYITKVADGYVRVSDGGKTEKFNENGKLVRVSDKNGNFIELSYGKDGRLQKLSDNFNRKMFFTFNTKGYLEKIQGENNKEATYRYNNLGELIWSKDGGGNVYTFKYSPDKHHNLIEIGYSDKTTLTVTYYGQDLHENVKTVKDRDGALTEYSYGDHPSDKNQSWVKVLVKGSDGHLISESKYEYFSKTKADGEEWTYKLITTLDGDRTETTYQEATGLPLVIKRDAEETSFEYDAKGHVTKKSTPTEVTELTYDSKIGKVTYVKRQSKTDKTDKSWSEFKYDDHGNLIYAHNSEKKGVKLFYDRNGRISSMMDQNKKRIDFKYNESSKPIQIIDPAVGSITVSYTNSGEIKKVESSAGRKIAMQVTSAFQNLLDIIRPAGVTLSF